MPYRIFILSAVAFGLYAQQTPVELASLRYIDLVEGAGAPAAPGKRLTVHYTGWLKDGTKFDSSVDRKEPFSFVQGRRQVITGWDIGFEGMKAGGKRKLFIPYQLAYGEAGTGPIPPKAELIFEVELLEVGDAPNVPPAVDVLLPYSDLETKVLALARSAPDERFTAIAPILRRIVSLNQSVPEAKAPRDVTVQGRTETVDLLAAGFAEVRKGMETARAGFLGGDATLDGQPTTRRGLYVALVRAIAEQYGRALEIVR